MAGLPEGKRVAPSILAADWSRMWEQVKSVMDAGARVIHVDVMDGHFVPPITMGPQMVKALSDHVHGAGGWLDVHLMIDRPEHQVEAFARAGADSINIHWEATPHVHYALKAVREAGCVPGLAINPATPPEAVTGVADMFDILLCMTVNPGWGGQPFIATSTDKIQRLRSLLPNHVAITVDGGIDIDTARPCGDAGARLFVAGSAVFGAQDPAEAYTQIVGAAGAS
ncbi:MAG TPA: ribulose-phosphate 3-epimerase [Thermoleophilaceae bacterium]